MKHFKPWPGVRTVTYEEMGYMRGRWYGDQEVWYWKAKRMKTHALLKKARREIQRLRAQINSAT